MKALKLIRSFGFIVIAIVSFVFANKVDDMRIGEYVSSSTYGGDAYTGIQNAAADTGSNVYKGNQIIQKGFKYIFILSGFGFLVVGLTPTLSEGNVPAKRRSEKVFDKKELVEINEA